jgi:hypothetical protein
MLKVCQLMTYFSRNSAVLTVSLLVCLASCGTSDHKEEDEANIENMVMAEQESDKKIVDLLPTPQELIILETPDAPTKLDSTDCR